MSDDKVVPFGHKRRAGLTRAQMVQIGRHLRSPYAGIENEPIPQRFLDLLKRLDEHEDRPRA